MNVRDIMTANPAVCTKDTSLTDVARMMVENDCGALPVVDNMNNRRPVGIITDRDIVTRTLADGKDPFEMAAGDCMTAAVYSVRPDASGDDCAAVMKEHQVRRVLVTDEAGRVCGIVAQADIAVDRSNRKTGDVVEGISENAKNR